MTALNPATWTSFDGFLSNIIPLLMTEALSWLATAGFTGEALIFFTGVVAALAMPTLLAVAAQMWNSSRPPAQPEKPPEQQQPDKKPPDPKEEPLVEVDPKERERVEEQEAIRETAGELDEKITQRQEADVSREATRLQDALTRAEELSQAEWDEIFATNEWWDQVDQRNQGIWNDINRWNQAQQWFDNFQRSMGSGQRWEDHHHHPHPEWGWGSR